MKLTIIMPVYNEEATLSEILRQVRAVELESIDKESIAVDDGSEDGSRAILEQEAKQGDLRLFHHDRNQILSSLEEIAARHPRLIYLSHGRAISGEELTSFLDQNKK